MFASFSAIIFTAYRFEGHGATGDNPRHWAKVGSTQDRSPVCLMVDV